MQSFILDKTINIENTLPQISINLILTGFNLRERSIS